MTTCFGSHSLNNCPCISASFSQHQLPLIVPKFNPAPRHLKKIHAGAARLSVKTFSPTERHLTRQDVQLSYKFLEQTSNNKRGTMLWHTSEAQSDYFFWQDSLFNFVINCQNHPPAFHSTRSQPINFLMYSEKPRRLLILHQCFFFIGVSYNWPLAVLLLMSIWPNTSIWLLIW